MVFKFVDKLCFKNKLTPSYARVKIPNTSPAHKYTQEKVTTMRIKDEIKFLHCKKTKTKPISLHSSYI